MKKLPLLGLFLCLFAALTNCNGSANAQASKEDTAAAMARYQAQEHRFEIRSCKLYYNGQQVVLDSLGTILPGGKEMKTDESYATSKKWKGTKYLPFIITEAPIEIDRNEVAPYQDKTLFPHFDDEKIIVQLSSNKGGYLFFSKMMLYGIPLYLVIALFHFIKSGFEEPFLNVVGVIFISLFIFLSILFKIKAHKAPDNINVIFHRLLGLIELPSVNPGKSFVIQFNDLKARHTSFTTSIYYSGKLIAFVRDATPYTVFRALQFVFGWVQEDWIKMSWSLNPMEYWSFYVWYMDRNRPLPPGSAFDAYRQKDYERRKAAGFPPPLYESKIPTPEYVPEGETSILDNLN